MIQPIKYTFFYSEIPIFRTTGERKFVQKLEGSKNREQISPSFYTNDLLKRIGIKNFKSFEYEI